MISAIPTRQAQITSADGRRLAYAEFGDREGRPVILFHGNPGSRLICPDVAVTIAAEVRLITFDRPGFGGSDPHPFHRLIDVADDFAQLASLLDVRRCSVIGWSAGGPYALAAAARHRDLVESAAVVSSAGLQDDPGVAARHTDHTRALMTRLRGRLPDAVSAVEDRFASYAEDPAVIVKMTVANEADPDRRLMRLPEVAAALSEMWREGARQGTRGVTDGWIALWALHPGFDPVDVTQPVAVWHGTGDVIVDVGEGARLAEALPDSHLHLLPGEGHLIALEHWAEILGSTQRQPPGSRLTAGG